VRTLEVADVLDLAAAQSSDAEERLQKLFEWDFERTMTSVRLLFAVAGSLLIALLAALIHDDAKLEIWHIATIVGSAGLLAAVAWSMLRRTRELHREFLAALGLLNSAQRLGPLLARYRAGGS
jgi:hypothetical protein